MITEVAAAFSEPNHWDSLLKINGRWKICGHHSSIAGALGHCYAFVKLPYRLTIFEIEDLADCVEGDIFIAISDYE
jgi:hypothetical protein